jgi:hypothetical protein
MAFGLRKVQSQRERGPLKLPLSIVLMVVGLNGLPLCQPGGAGVPKPAQAPQKPAVNVETTVFQGEIGDYGLVVGSGVDFPEDARPVNGPGCRLPLAWGLCLGGGGCSERHPRCRIRVFRQPPQRRPRLCVPPGRGAGDEGGVRAAAAATDRVGCAS